MLASSRSSLPRLPPSTHGPGSRTKWKVETLAVDLSSITRPSFVQTQESRHKAQESRSELISILEALPHEAWSCCGYRLHGMINGGTDMTLSWTHGDGVDGRDDVQSVFIATRTRTNHRVDSCSFSRTSYIVHRTSYLSNRLQRMQKCRIAEKGGRRLWSN